MEIKTYGIGLMSGTSLDGLDICYVSFDKENNFNLIHAETFSYKTSLKNKLKNAINLKAEELFELDVNFGYYLGEQVKLFIEKYFIEKVDFVASHGHTIFHQPNKNFTLQIGHGAAIASVCNQKVICDFRIQDVILGGQGAPLVPIGDELLFNNYDACLNLGGFSNVSFNRNNKRVAFDICPVNIVLNHFANTLGLEYDKDGEIAKTGIVNQDLLGELNNLPFYNQNYPKSLGYEWVKDEFLTIVDKYKIPIENILKTLIEHIVCQIKICFEKYNINNVLITGGGVKNKFLIDLLRSNTSVEIIIPNQKIIDFKEALIFAFLGYRKLNNQINCLASVTGAVKDHSSGIIF